jgi:hypothetical protein
MQYEWAGVVYLYSSDRGAWLVGQVTVVPRLFEFTALRVAATADYTLRAQAQGLAHRDPWLEASEQVALAWRPMCRGWRLQPLWACPNDDSPAVLWHTQVCCVQQEPAGVGKPLLELRDDDPVEVAPWAVLHGFSAAPSDVGQQAADVFA